MKVRFGSRLSAATHAWERRRAWSSRMHNRRDRQGAVGEMSVVPARSADHFSDTVLILIVSLVQRFLPAQSNALKRKKGFRHGL